MKAVIKPRILYLTEWAPYAENGVLKKLISLVQAWRSLDADAMLVSVTTIKPTKPALDFDTVGVVSGVIKQKWLERFPLLRLGYINKIASVYKTKAVIKKFAPDFIYYRQNGPWYPGVSTLLSGRICILEINTDEDSEYHLWGRWFAMLHKYTNRLTLNKVAGVVAVTNQIARRYRESGIPVVVIGNSMWGPHQPLQPTGNAIPRFVFVGSKTVNAQNWHGVDQLFLLAGAMPDIKFEVVGLTAADFPGVAIPSNVTMHGERHGPALVEIYKKCDIGLGSLAMYRIGLVEAAPLKTREYLMYGLPIVITYDDVQPEINTANFVLKLPNTEDGATSNVEQVREFALRWCGRRVTENLDFLTQEAAARRRVEFMQQLAASRSK